MKPYVYCSIIAFFLLQSVPARALTIRTPDNQALETQDNSITIINPTPRVNLPGLSFTPGQNIEGQLNENGQVVIGIPYLAEYIAAAYKYAVAIASILAVVMIIVAGIQWTASGGNPETITSAKHRIAGAVTGLVIALGSYTLLYTINPELVQFRNLRITYVQPKSLAYLDGGDPAIGGAQPVDITKIKAAFPSIICPGSGLTAVIPDIVNSMKFRMAYRLGGRGQPPPPDYPEKAPYESYAKTCPPGNLCFDCSGFVNLVYKCAGLPDPGGTTTEILQAEKGAVELKDCEIPPKDSNSKDSPRKISGGIDFENNQYCENGKPELNLKPGDILGWRPGEGHQYGHVVLYIGNGQTVEMSGGFPGRQVGSNPTFKSLTDFNGAEGYKFTWLRHAP